MKKLIKLLLVKASPSSDGYGSRILKNLEEFIMEKMDCELVIYDQEKESIEFGKSNIQQFVEAGKKDETRFEKMIMESDGIIIFSPVYLRQMPGEFKITLDRFSYRMHEFPLIGKKVITFAYCNSNGADDLVKYFNTIFTSAGAEIISSEEYYQALECYDDRMLQLKNDIQIMYARIEKNLFNVTQKQEQLFQYYKAITMHEKEKGIKTNRQKRWSVLNEYESLCDYIEATYIKAT